MAQQATAPFTTNTTTTEGQLPVLVVGTASVSGGRLRFAERASLSPFLAYDLETGEQRVTAAVGTGDAIYFRVANANNWWRVRLRREKRQNNQVVNVPTRYGTEYTATYTHADHSGSGTPVETTVRKAYRDSRPPLTMSYTHTHKLRDGSKRSYTSTYRQTAISSRQYVKTAGYSYVATVVEYLKHIVLEKSVNGAVTQAGSVRYADKVNISSLSALAIHDKITVFNPGSEVPALEVVDGTHRNFVLAGIGKGGPTDTEGSALDNFTGVPQIFSPQLPTLLAPSNNSMIDLASGFVFQVRFNDANPEDEPSGYRMRRKLDASPTYEYKQIDGTWGPTETDLPIEDNDRVLTTQEVWPNSRWSWSMNVRDTDTRTWSGYANDLVVVGNTPPRVVIVAPDAEVYETNSPTIRTDYIDDQGNPQAEIHFKIFLADAVEDEGFNPDTATAVWDSGRRVTAETDITPDVRLANNTRYYAYVKVWQTSNVASLWSRSEFVITISPPGQPSVAAFFDDVRANGLLEVESRDNLLSAAAASAENNEIGWQGRLNVADISAAEVRSTEGALSWELTPIGPGAIEVDSDSNFLLEPGETYTLMANLSPGRLPAEVEIGLLVEYVDGTVGRLGLPPAALSTEPDAPSA